MRSPSKSFLHSSGATARPGSLEAAWPPKAAAATASLVAPEQRAEVAGGCVAASRAVLAAALFASPWAFGAVQTWAWTSVGAVAALAVFLWAVGSVRKGALRIAWSPLHSLAGLFLLWGMVQRAGGLSLNLWATREAVFKFATDFLFFFLAAQLWHGAAAKTWRWFGFLRSEEHTSELQSLPHIVCRLLL